MGPLKLRALQLVLFTSTLLKVCVRKHWALLSRTRDVREQCCKRRRGPTNISVNQAPHMSLSLLRRCDCNTKRRTLISRRLQLRSKLVGLRRWIRPVARQCTVLLRKPMGANRKKQSVRTRERRCMTLRSVQHRMARTETTGKRQSWSRKKYARNKRWCGTIYSKRGRAPLMRSDRLPTMSRHVCLLIWKRVQPTRLLLLLLQLRLRDGLRRAISRAHDLREQRQPRSGQLRELQKTQSMQSWRRWNLASRSLLSS